MFKRFVLFLVCNFAALGIGTLFMPNPQTDPWYQSLSKAPWTPPGWVFGAAWFSIMVLFAVYMAITHLKVQNPKKLVLIYTVQWFLNVGWNAVFFTGHYVFAGLIVITLLQVSLFVLFFNNRKAVEWRSLFLLPYIFWLFIAISLNAYIFLN